MPPAGFIQNELDLKLLVLYIMDRAAGPLTFYQLLELALCDGGVDYFSLTQAVDHMVSTGQLSREGERYAITEKGRRNSEICRTSLPYSVRMHCDDNLARVNESLRLEAQLQTGVEDNGDGTFTLRLQLNDVSTPLLQLSLLVPSREQAQEMAGRFRAAPAQLYHQISRLLTQDGDAAHAPPQTPGNAG